MKDLTKARELSINLGTVQTAENASVEFGEKEFATHMAVYGGTGKGKTKYLELIIRQLIDQRRGVCVIDPHGDLVEDLLTYVMQRKDALDPHLMRRIHYFEPGLPDCGFSFDPFHYQPSTDGSFDYKDWLKAKVESVARVIIRKQGESDFQGKPRLERFLTNVLYAVGTAINEKGDHLPLADAEILLNTSHPNHNAVFNAVKDILPLEVLADFQKVRKSNPRQQEDWVESTIGRLRSFLSPIIKSLFTNEAEQPVNFRQIVEQQGVMLVNLRRTRSFTLDQSNALGGLFINEILEAVETADRTNRKPFFLFIDEASRYVGQDLMDALGQFRKWKLSMCLAVQDLSSLQGKEIDMTPKVMSQCGIQVTFQQKYPDDVETLASLFGYPALDFTRLIHEVDRPDGYNVVDTESVSRGGGKNQSAASGEARSTSFNTEFGVKGHGLSRSDNKGESSSDTWSVTNGQQYLSRFRVEERDTGRLRTSVQDQLDYVKMRIRNLKMGEALTLVDGVKPFVLKVHNVAAAFATISDEKRAATLQKYKRRICQSHKYCVKGQRLTELQRVLAFVTKDETPRREVQDENPFNE